MGLLDFMERGPGRREWLDDNVSDFMNYITPPNLRPAVEFAGQMNPIQGMSDSMSQFGVAIDPDRSMDERRRAAMQSLTEGLVAVAPAALSASGFMKPAQASMEGLLGWSPAGRQIADDMGQFLADEAGSLRLARGTDAEAMARDILDLRAAGRASEVTDDMMAKADPQYMFNNTPLPMDQASRMARADEMGFNPSQELYHGSGADFQGFEVGRDRFDGTSAQVRGQGVYLSEFPSQASSYAPRGRREGGQVYDVLENTSNPYEGIDSFDTIAERTKYLTTEGQQDLSEYGFDANKSVMGAPVVFDPSNIRSRFARFDPEFRHLANLSAGIGAVGLLGSINRDEIDRETAAYLGGI